jgi:hypothetical protein
VERGIRVLENVEDASEGVPVRCNIEVSCRVVELVVVRSWLAHCVKVGAPFLVAYVPE